VPAIDLNKRIPGFYTTQFTSGTTTMTVNQIAQQLNIKRTTVNTPNFRKGRPKWTIPMNPFTFTQEKRLWLNGRYDTWYLSNGREFHTIYNGDLYSVVSAPELAVPFLSTADRAALDAECRNKLRGKIKDQKANLVQFHVERKQLFNMVAATVDRVTKCVTALKKGHYHAAARALGVSVSHRKERKYRRSFARDQSKAVSNGWLELRYGWLPLVDDVHGTAELLAQKVSREIKTKSTAVVKETRTVKSSSTDYAGRKTDITGTITYAVRYGVYYSSASEAVHTLAQMGITNPALIAWELTPWSFVVDWFLPIGNWLSSFDATIDSWFEKGYTTVFERYQITQVYSGIATKTSPSADPKTFWLLSSVDYVKCNRAILSSFPSPGLPSFKNPFSLIHNANAMALLRQTFKR
jgi:hypothetical protein